MLALALASGCAPSTPSAPSTARRDASVDASSSPVDAAADLDGGALELPDAHEEPTFHDSGAPECILPDGSFDLCACGTFAADCASAPCAIGEDCVDDPCGRHCVPHAACMAQDDCASGSECTMGRCTRESGCGDSRDCALGFACEAGACVDRRVTCGPGADCPHGFVCDSAHGLPVCVRALRRCVSDTACGAGMQCVDVDGDGLRECLADGTCDSNRDCPDRTCQTLPTERVAVCGDHGTCTEDSECPAGRRCRDLWGDGARECVLPGGCESSSACPAGALCATDASGGAPRCLSRGPLSRRPGESI
jgi:hypothetical protein